MIESVKKASKRVEYVDLSETDTVNDSREPDLPLLSVVIPAFNEQALLEAHLHEIVSALNDLSDEFRSEVIIVNDGSHDRTREIVDRVARENSSVIALHHPRNFGLGQALSFGFSNTKGDYVVTLDVDLSYDVRHIGELARTIRDQRVKLVLASPYMKGGVIANVPWHRRILSVLGNRFLSIFVEGSFSTLTSVMRAYDGKFIRSLNLRALGMDVMPETVYKTQILGGSILEVPARLDWGPQMAYTESRLSSMRIIRHVFSTIFAGFIFRPFLFFVIPGILLLVFAAYVNFWMFSHYFEAVGELRMAGELASFSDGLALAYDRYPHTFIFGLLTTMLSIQLVGLGILALQSKQNFEELFHLGTRSARKEKQESMRE